jgi:hypothetical protein
LINVIVFIKTDLGPLESFLQLSDGLSIRNTYLVFNSSDQFQLRKALDLIHSSRIKSLSLVYHGSDDLDFKALIRDYIRIVQIEIHNQNDVQDTYYNGVLIKTIKYNGYHTIQAPSYDFFTKSLAYNSYYFKLLVIDESGNIKNSFSEEGNFENIHDISSHVGLMETVECYPFNKYWSISKDKITVCRDCDLRHMCLDSRLPNLNNENEWFHELECKYNPFIAKWSNEDNYLSLNECGVIDDVEGFRIRSTKSTSTKK